MKKILVIAAILVSILCYQKQEKIIIPKEAIRFRIIANSNSEEDQEIKKKIVEDLSTTLKETENGKSIEETRKNIQKNLPLYEEIVDKSLKRNSEQLNFHINYGKNYFPRKEYKDVIYEEGEYESLVITLGEGNGNNFWCVLFPPLCFIDVEEDIEYKSFIKEIINKYF